MAKKALNPMNPGMDRPYTQSPVLKGGGKPMKQSPILGAAANPKANLEKATKPNLKNMGKSIKPTVKSKPYGEGY